MLAGDSCNYEAKIFCQVFVLWANHLWVIAIVDILVSQITSVWRSLGDPRDSFINYHQTKFLSIRIRLHNM
jgi:hypothetical protein